MKKTVVILMLFAIMLSFCACNSNETPQEPSANEESTFVATLPDSVCVQWYPQPDNTDQTITIYNDGTCNIYGSDYEYTVDIQNDFDIVLIAGSHTLYLSQVNSPLPLLFEETSGYFVPYLDLWHLEGDWYCDESGKSFTLNFTDIPNWNCTLDVGDNYMDISFTNDSGTDYSVMIWMDYENPVAEVNSSDGDFWVFYNTAYGSGGSNQDDPAYHTLEDLVEDLNTVLDGGAVYEYIPEEDIFQALYGSEALAYLYPQFQQLNTPEAQDYLTHFVKQPDVLRHISLQYSFTDSLNQRSVAYNAYGHLSSNCFIMSDVYGDYIYYIYDMNGDISQVSLFDIIQGTPVFDTDGRLVAVDVTYGDAIYSAQLTYNEDQQIVRIDIPFPCSARIDEVPSDSTEQHEFIYDENGKLLQSTVTVIPRNMEKYDADFVYCTQGFARKGVREYIYDEDGRLSKRRYHDVVFADQFAVGGGSWSYSETEYFYDHSGRLLSIQESHYTVGNNHIELDTAHNSLFHSSGLVDSIENKTIEAIGDYLECVATVVTEFTYEDIYVYVP